MAKRDAFTDELDEFVTQAEAFATYGELDRMAENVQKLSDLEAKMADARTRAEALSSEEELLGFPRSQFPQLEEVPPRSRRQGSVVDGAGFLEELVPVAQRADDGDRPRGGRGRGEGAVEGQLQNDQDVQRDGPRRRVNQTPPLKVAEALKVKIDQFQEKLPLISAMCNKGCASATGSRSPGDRLPVRRPTRRRSPR